MWGKFCTCWQWSVRRESTHSQGWEVWACHQCLRLWLESCQGPPEWLLCQHRDGKAGLGNSGQISFLMLILCVFFWCLFHSALHTACLSYSKMTLLTVMVIWRYRCSWRRSCEPRAFQLETRFEGFCAVGEQRSGLCSRVCNNSVLSFMSWADTVLVICRTKAHVTSEFSVMEK